MHILRTHRLHVHRYSISSDQSKHANNKGTFKLVLLVIYNRPDKCFISVSCVKVQHMTWCWSEGDNQCNTLPFSIITNCYIKAHTVDQKPGPLLHFQISNKSGLYRSFFYTKNRQFIFTY